MHSHEPVSSPGGADNPRLGFESWRPSQIYTMHSHEPVSSPGGAGNPRLGFESWRPSHFCGFPDHLICDSTISDSVTTMAPPIRVATCAKGISTMRLAAVRIAMSPVPPWPECVALMMAASIG